MLKIFPTYLAVSFFSLATNSEIYEVAFSIILKSITYKVI